MIKLRRTIASEDVDRVFTGKCIEKLAARLPAGADRRRFAKGIREAARIYARDAREPTANELRAEIAASCSAVLHRSGVRRPSAHASECFHR